MKRFKNLLIIIILSSIMTQLLSLNVKALHSSSNVLLTRPINAGVLLYSFDDIFLSLVKKSLEDIEKENKDKIKFTFFDGKSNSAIQSENLDKAIQGNFDFLVLNVFQRRKELAEESFTKLKQSNIPIILLASNIPETNAFITNNKAFALNLDPIEEGVIQGKLVVDAWNANKESIDKNKDNILQYVMLKGIEDNIYAQARTKYSIDTIENSGIKTQELASVPAEWNKELAKNAISSLFLRYGNKIEAIISNNDAMAIGAVEALQKFGYNKGDKSRTISVFGIDAIPEAKDLIKKGYMAGSVFQDPAAIAKAIYDVGRNLVSEQNPIEGTDLKLNDKEIIVPLAYQPYTINSD